MISIDESVNLVMVSGDIQGKKYRGPIVGQISELMDLRSQNIHQFYHGNIPFKSS